MGIRSRAGWRLACAGLVVLLASCAQAPVDTRPRADYFWLVHSNDRSDADRIVDQRRHPEKLLAFYDVRSGMRVLDMSAGGGYNTELLARAVQPAGVVYAQISPDSMERVGPRFAERAQKAVMKNVVLAVRSFEDPVPPEAKDLDLVTFNFNYHDLPAMKVDRAKMNRAIFNALKPGGVYIVADHSGRPGTGFTEGNTLHRVDEAAVRREVEAAGFRFVGEAGFLRNPDDPRDAPVFKPKQPNDEFVMRFEKPLMR